MKCIHSSKLASALGLAGALALLAAPAQAQQLSMAEMSAKDPSATELPAADLAAADLPEMEINRDVVDLESAIRPPPDVDTTNTAMVFNNARFATAIVRCIGYNRNGRPVGRIWLKVPGNGVRLAFASDLSNGLDFVGSARCWATGGVVPSAFVVGPGLTDAPVKVRRGWNFEWIRFPIVASF